MRLSWLFHRLAAMGPAEIAWRVAEQSKRYFAKYRLQGAGRYQDRSHAAPSLPGLSPLFDTITIEDRDAVKNASNEALDGRFSSLGVTWPKRDPGNLFPASIWSTDPVTGAHWPTEPYCFAIPYRHQSEIGDVKYVWEFGRLQFLQALAAEFRLSGDPAALAAIEQAIKSWWMANPPFRGIHYAEILNVAMRAISLLVVASLCGDSLSPDVIAILRTALRAHATWLSWFPSRFSSANNHLVAELAAEYLIGVAMGGDEFSRMREKAWSGLVREVGLQILPDGVNAEQSPAYGAFTAEFALLACLVARGEGRVIPPLVEERLIAYARQIFLLADANGRVANLCDNDEGRVLTLCQHEPIYSFSIATAICGFFNIPASSKAVAPPTLRMALFGRPTGGPAPSDRLQTFTHGGISVIRGALGGKPYLLTFDHAPLGYLSIAAHGHADALSFTLTVDDQPVLVDPGTYLYHSGGAWRSWFRGTRAHNSLNIDGADQSVMSGAFNWSHKANSRLEQATAEGDVRLVASHDGYLKRFGMRHRRAIAADDEGITIVDQLEGNGSRLAEIVFQTDPAVTVDRIGTGIVLRRGGIALAELVLPASGEILIAAGDERDGGWVSEKFGTKVPAYRIAWRGEVPENGVITRIVRPDR